MEKNSIITQDIQPRTNPISSFDASRISSLALKKKQDLFNE